ncbi:nitrilase-related carbon-nitrogen hydrolase [Paeniroseomonas aquatica]|uniref:nitrilase-related carbon-nitrogen hydrolase n=1 Tax=Paeniroseomonas aquatica TaxID=373043 RepID=UPI0036235943
MTALRLGVLAWPVGNPRDVAGYAARLEGFVAEAAGRADLLLMPEYASVELAAGGAGEAGELRAMVAEAPAVLEAMRGVARRHGIWLLPGSLPMPGADGRVLNRAPLIAPDGRLAFQDKMAMTRFEAERWGIAPGAGPQVFDTPWGRLGVSICYDADSRSTSAPRSRPGPGWCWCRPARTRCTASTASASPARRGRWRTSASSPWRRRWARRPGRPRWM